MDKKEIAVEFLKMAARGEVDEAYEKYVSPDFHHHNPYFKSDRETLRLAMKEAAVQNPNKIYEVRRTIEEGNLVAVHGRLVLESGNKEMAVVHILRFEGNKIVEEWEAGNEIPADSQNEDGAF
ncbi:MAG: nuclear transport factor 2 family protein [Nanoarchaeota archaeon]|nr:nuclear transport factor 2 family protein [Nanoarchaeota archaeon]